MLGGGSGLVWLKALGMAKEMRRMEVKKNFMRELMYKL